jgi:hypothetical protein
MERIVLLGYVVKEIMIEMDEVKIKTIQEWPIPKTVSDVRSFHSLSSFYIRFAKNSITLVAPLTEIVREMVVF